MYPMISPVSRGVVTLSSDSHYILNCIQGIICNPETLIVAIYSKRFLEDEI